MSEVYKTFHCCLCVRGALRWPKYRLKGMFRDEKGKKTTADETREILLDRLADGWEVLPIGEPCEGFDKKTGCPGHIEKGVQS